MQYESRSASLFALCSLSRPRYSRLAARISHSLSRRSSGRDFRAKERLLAVYVKRKRLFNIFRYLQRTFRFTEITFHMCLLLHLLYSVDNRLVYRSFFSNHFVNFRRLHFLCGLHFNFISRADYDYGFEENKVLLDPTQVVAVISQSSSWFRSPSTKRVTARSRRKRVPPLSLISPKSFQKSRRRRIHISSSPFVKRGKSYRHRGPQHQPSYVA